MDFLNWPFLAGAAAALAPVLIHLIQRRRVQRVVFGSLRFLRKTSHHVVHRRRFEEVLLVILRAAALGLLAAGFARPLLRQDPQDGVGGDAPAGEEAALVLVDNSYSMRAEGRLDRARQEAVRFIRQGAAAAKVGVAAFSTRLDELCPVGSAPAQAIEAVEGIQPSWRGTDLGVALKQAGRILTRSGRNEARRRVVLIGDFQNSSWRVRDDPALPPGVELTIRNVAQAAVPNVVVCRVATPRLVVAGGFVEAIAATVRNLTDRPLTDAVVSLRLGGELKETRTIHLRPGEEAPVAFRHKFTEPGDATGSITVQADDALPEDNTAWFCVPATPRVHVLLVNADAREKAVLDDGLFVTAALAPQVEGVVSPFEVRQVEPERMQPGDLDGADVVLFLNVCRLPPAMTDIPPDRRDAAPAYLPGAGRDRHFHSPLGRFLAREGGIGLVCGSKVQAAEFNRTFEGLAPCELSRRAMQAGDPPVVINQMDLRHEVFAEFALPHSGDMSLAEFTQYFLVTGSPRAQAPARFSSAEAHPAMLERAFGDEAAGGSQTRRVASGGPGLGQPEASGRGTQPGPKGRSILLVSSLDLEWNNLCLKSVFVPFVHQLTRRLCARRAGGIRNFAVGEEIAYPLPGPPGQVRVRRMADRPVQAGAAGGPADFGELSRAAGEWEDLPDLPAGQAGLSPQPAARPGPAESGGGTDLGQPGRGVSFSPPRPGIYELAHDGGSARFAVNIDGDEADLRPLDTKLLISAVRGAPQPASHPPAGGPPLAAGGSARQRIENHQKLWRYLLLATMVVLAAEMLLSRRIGRA